MKKIFISLFILLISSTLYAETKIVSTKNFAKKNLDNNFSVGQTIADTTTLNNLVATTASITTLNVTGNTILFNDGNTILYRDANATVFDDASTSRYISIKLGGTDRLIFENNGDIKSPTGNLQISTVKAYNSNGLSLLDDGGNGYKLYDTGKQFVLNQGSNLGYANNEYGGSVVNGATVTNNEYIDLTVPLGSVGTLYVSNVDDDTTYRTYAVLSICLRSTTLSQQTEYTVNGSGGAAAFTVSCPAENVLRITNNRASLSPIFLRARYNYLSAD